MPHHFRALQAATNCLPTDLRRRRGRPRRTWLRTIESDLQPTNLGLNLAWLRAQDRSKWRSVVETAMLTELDVPPDDDDDDDYALGLKGGGYISNEPPERQSTATITE